MKNTTTTRRNSARNQSAAIVAEVEAMTQAETITEAIQAENPAIEDSPSISIPDMTDEQLQESIDCHEAIHEENGSCEVDPFLNELYSERDKRQRAANLEEVKFQIDSYDGKPKSIQLAEYKSQFDFMLSLCGKYKNKTGESNLTAWEFTLALLNHASIDNDGVNPSPAFLAQCKAIADKRERPLTPEEKAEMKRKESIETRLSIVRNLWEIVAGDREKINKFLKLQGHDAITEDEFTATAKHFA